MLEKYLRGWLISLLIILSVNFCTGTASVTARNTTQPVMLGPVHQVHGDNKPRQLYKKDEFEIGVQDMDTTSGGGGGVRTRTIIKDGAEKVDVWVMKKSSGPKEKVVVDKVYVHSSVQCFIVGCGGRNDYAGIEGGIFTTQPIQGSEK
jgi:hypothetical protein